MASALFSPRFSTSSTSSILSLSTTDWPKGSAPTSGRLARRMVKALGRLCSDRRWLGATRLDEHLVICGFPRSGTTLLQLMCEVGYPDALAFGRERRALACIHEQWWGAHPRMVTKRPDDLFWIDEIRAAYRRRPTRVAFVVCVRDPRDVLTSVHDGRSGYYVSATRLAAAYECVTKVRLDADVAVVRYESLVKEPEHVQERVESLMGRRAVGRFREAVRCVPPSFDTTALSGVRPVEPGRVERWRGDRHEARLRSALRETPRLLDIVRGLGYAQNDDWAQRYVEGTRSISR